MGSKVKAFFKGLRYFAHIFDDQKEHEIQIGFPTDVKHVAHIGSDGSSANQPSWMNEFKGSEASSMVDANDALSSPGSMKTASQSSIRNISEELVVRNEIPKTRHKYSSNTDSPSCSPKRGSDGTKQCRRRTKVKDNSTNAAAQESSGTTQGSSGSSKNSRSNRSADGSIDSIDQDSGNTPASSDKTKHPMRNRSDDDTTNSPSKDSSKRSSRRNHSSEASNDSQTKDSSSNTRRSKASNPGSESPSQDQPIVPKQSRQKKSDGSSKGKPSRSKKQGLLITDIQLDDESVDKFKTM